MPGFAAHRPQRFLGAILAGLMVIAVVLFLL